MHDWVHTYASRGTRSGTAKMVVWRETISVAVRPARRCDATLLAGDNTCRGGVLLTMGTPFGHPVRREAFHPSLGHARSLVVVLGAPLATIS